MTEQGSGRVSALREVIAGAGLDGLLVSHLPNVRYLTGFSGSNALLLVSQTGLSLFTDFRYEEQVRHEVPSSVTVFVEEASLWEGLWREMSADRRLARIGFETNHLLHRDFSRLLEHRGGVQWDATADLVERLRERKSEAEILLITEAVRIAEEALEATLGKVRAGLTEVAVAGILEHEMRERGSEGLPFATIVATGPRSSLPHARPGKAVLERGDILLIDFGAVWQGYCSDITRTFVIGPASERQKEIHAIVREANALASGALRPEMKGMDADGIAREYIARKGFGKEFGHSLGHGIGLEIHEAPRLTRTNPEPIPENSAVTIEPGIYLPGWGGVRIEDDVVVTGNGPRVLTAFPRELISIG